MTENILDKLRKIKAHASSAKDIGSEAEALAFAEMLQQLLLKHKLQMSDLEYEKEQESEPIIELWPDRSYETRGKKFTQFYKDAPSFTINRKTRMQWSEDLANVVTEYTSCKFLVVPGRSLICIVGHRSNAELASYLFLKMGATAETMSDIEAKRFRRNWRAGHGSGVTPPGFRESFLFGFVRHIRERLEAIRQAHGQTQAIVRVGKEAKEVQDYLNNKFAGRKSPLKNDKGPKKLKDFNSHGYAQGIATANSIELNKGSLE